jgi:hypothetical protein
MGGLFWGPEYCAPFAVQNVLRQFADGLGFAPVSFFDMIACTLTSAFSLLQAAESLGV